MLYYNVLDSRLSYFKPLSHNKYIQLQDNSHSIVSVYLFLLYPTPTNIVNCVSNGNAEMYAYIIIYFILILGGSFCLGHKYLEVWLSKIKKTRFAVQVYLLIKKNINTLPLTLINVSIRTISLRILTLALIHIYYRLCTNSCKLNNFFFIFEIEENKLKLPWPPSTTLQSP